MSTLTNQRLSLSANSGLESLKQNPVSIDNFLTSSLTSEVQSNIPSESLGSGRDSRACGSRMTMENNRSRMTVLQSGRSMIEMLGVLAIIGVLSVGGIAGYSKAMTRYRINKTADQITQIAQNIRAFYGSQKNYNGLDTNVLKKAKLVPDEMWDGTNSSSLTNPFGGSVSIRQENKMSGGYSDGKAFVIIVGGIPQEACMELVTQDWGSGSSSGLIALGRGTGVLFASYGCTYSDNEAYCATQGVMPISTAISMCTSETNNTIAWKFY